jgi:hypothetical protein
MTGVSVLAETVDEYARTHRVVGVTAEPLAARAQNAQGGITARALKRWLLDEGLAYELPDRSLRPTLRAYVVGRGLR